MKMTEIVEGTIDDLKLRGHGAELDRDDDDSVAVKLKGEPMQVQLMRIEDSEEDDDIKNPVRSVVTSDGQKIKVDRPEAISILKALKSPNGKPEQKLQLQKKIQDSKGLITILNILRKKK
ncbi:hypothetical protein N9C48_01540 [bacterium]|nr:hypothetical protein [bacterium]